MFKSYLNLFYPVLHIFLLGYYRPTSTEDFLCTLYHGVYHEENSYMRKSNIYKVKHQRTSIKYFIQVKYKETVSFSSFSIRKFLSIGVWNFI